MADLTPELLAQLEKDAAWLSPDEGPYRLGIDGERTIDGEEEDADEMTIYGILDDGASHEVATFHVDNMAPRAVRLFAAVPALVAAAKERDQLRARIENQLGTISKLREEIAESDDDENEELAACSKQLDVYAEERAKMIAEAGTLRAEISSIRGALDVHGHDGTFEAAAKLRDEAVKLRAEVEQIAGTSLGAMRRETAQLRDMLASAKAEIAELRHPLARRPPEDACLRVECAQLRIDVDRLRAIGLEAVKVLDRCGIETNFRALIGESRVRDFDPLGPADRLPADVLADVETERGMLQIERKP